LGDLHAYENKEALLNNKFLVGFGRQDQKDNYRRFNRQS